jgi:hypothetical protein
MNRWAGKSTLNGLELCGHSGRYHKVSYSAEANYRRALDRMET